MERRAPRGLAGGYRAAAGPAVFEKCRGHTQGWHGLVVVAGLPALRHPALEVQTVRPAGGGNRGFLRGHRGVTREEQRARRSCGE